MSMAIFNRKLCSFFFESGNPTQCLISDTANGSATQLASGNGFLRRKRVRVSWEKLLGAAGGVVFMLYSRCIQRLLL